MEYLLLIVAFVILWVRISGLKGENGKLQQQVRDLQRQAATLEHDSEFTAKRLSLLEKRRAAAQPEPAAAPPVMATSTAPPLDRTASVPPAVAPTLVPPTPVVPVVPVAPEPKQEELEQELDWDHFLDETFTPPAAPATAEIASVQAEPVAAFETTRDAQSHTQGSAQRERGERAFPPAPVSRPADARRQATRRAYVAEESPDFVERAFSACVGWLFGGNTVVRVGVVLLFIGLAFLLRYATERYSLPVELRYAGVTLTALVLLSVGWRLRLKNAAYGLMLQGTGIAVLYLTSFAAMHLHQLLSTSAVFPLLVLLTVFAVMLAVMQDALALACVAVMGGFAAPLLASTGGGHHVGLFSYFALLNSGIALIAWFKAWRVLNLIGFLGTFSIGFAWGLKRWQPELFATTEPFLVLFFLMYVLIGFLFARRKLLEAGDAPEDRGRRAMLKWSARNTDYVDGTMVFGPPLIGFGLQCVLVNHIEFGAAYSALGLGFFYLLMAFFMQGRPRVSLLKEICLALGVVFGTLAIPLALDAQGTSVVWAVEAAGIYWLSFRQRRHLARVFALGLIIAAAATYVADIRLGVDTLLDARPLGALLLGGALLFCHRSLRRAEEEALEKWDRQCLPVFAFCGLSFLYLIPPACFALEATVICWALAGVATLFAGIPLRSRPFLTPAFGIQLLGGALFLFNLQPGIEGGVLASGWRGVISASLIGFALIASAVIAQNDAMARKNPALANRLGLALLVGLVFVNLAALFVFQWTATSATWAGSGLLILWLGLAQRQRKLFYFGLALEAVAAFAFVGTGAHLPVIEHFAAPVALSLAALVGAWRLHHAAHAAPAPSRSRRSRHHAEAAFVSPVQLELLSNLLLGWGIIWWAWTSVSLVDQNLMIYLGDWALKAGGPRSWSLLSAYATLIVLSLSALLWMLVARFAQWRGMALATLVPILFAAKAWLWNGVDLIPLVGWGWVLFFCVHFVGLRTLAGVLPAWAERGAHVVGCWVLVGVLALTAHDSVAELANMEAASAWNWLGWALVPSLYLLLAGSERIKLWPLKAFAQEYRLYAALPVMGAMLVWLWQANFHSNGAADPLPYVPILNPLEVALLLVLLTCWHWSRRRLPELGISPLRVGRATNIVAGASLLAFASLVVCRATHHWDGVAFNAYALTRSMNVQAGWSLVWSLFGLALMIGGSRSGLRSRWMAGALLMAIVVLKLFFVELEGHGSFARIVSFIGVGVLLLIVGYFSPLPPRAEETQGRGRR
ncbi:hypothetical protein FACS1894116_00420 [Betaproteobacteria bacterium]|nr:hypothetical protein FACS1894116_00420 [Betaproteobacteria bacterium]GHU21499.1 hypothetical protein FACS189488_00200 [Betaproteobacteria bacterium]GHU28959.1 hypothetical protein FACS189497_05750 [Betaproteobacteria bacterium]